MNKPTIWKYQLPMEPDFFIEMPVGGKVLTIQIQDKQPVMWVIVDPDGKTEHRHFWWIGTGDSSFHLTIDKYIGTIQIVPLVFHLFERQYDSEATESKERISQHNRSSLK